MMGGMGRDSTEATPSTWLSPATLRRRLNPLGDRNPRQVLGDDKIAVKHLSRLVAESLAIGVSLREMGQHEAPRTQPLPVPPDARSGARSESPILSPRSGRCLDYQQVGTIGQGVDGVAQPGVHNKPESLATPRLADFR